MSIAIVHTTVLVLVLISFHTILYFFTFCLYCCGSTLVVRSTRSGAELCQLQMLYQSIQLGSTQILYFLLSGFIVVVQLLLYDKSLQSKAVSSSRFKQVLLYNTVI